MGIGAECVAELLADIETVVELTFERYGELVRDDPDVPRDTARLAEGIEIAQTGPYTATIESTARSDDGADYGLILDESTGQPILPVDKQALASADGEFGPVASSTVSTAHVGWWDQVNRDEHLEQAWDEAVALLE